MEREGPGPGRLKVFLGYAAGVGKTFRMLEEAASLVAQGADVVVGYFEPHGRQDTIAKTQGLEILPRRRIEYRGCTFEEMDTDAIRGRRPAVCAVDELAHTNVPGSPRKKRWEDVVLLLEAGIDVLTTMNVQHLESLNDRMREIAGIEVRETVPDWILKEAAEVVLVDLPPRALLNRLARGVVYPPEKVAQALDHFFKEPTLAALREMALRHTAHEIEVRQEGPGASLSSALAEPPEAREGVLIHVTEDPSTAALIRRGRRVADYLKGECFAVAVLPPGPAPEGSRRRPAIDEHLSFARRLHVETHVLEAADVAAALVAFARSKGVTQVFLARPRARPLPLVGRRETAMRVIELATDMQVTVVAERRPSAEKQP